MGSLVLMDTASDLLAKINVGRIKGVAYDTAWAARPLTDEQPEFPGAMRWLLKNQRWDGSWGSEIDYKHDRVLSTTAALIALEQNDGHKYGDRIESGLEYLWRNMDALDKDPYETIGSELLLPALLEEAEDLGISVPSAPDSIKRKRDRKLGLIPEEMIYSTGTSLAYSLEYLGKDVKAKDLIKCISPNGSLGCSPSATMFLLDHTGDKRAKEYLYWVSKNMTTGGFPSQLPFETFESAWSLYNFIKAGWTHRPWMEDVAERLFKIWRQRGDGVSWGNDFPISDSDTSAITFKVLMNRGYTLDARVFERFERDDGFISFDFELNPSASANIHILEAIKDVPRCDLARKEEMIEKIIKFLEKCSNHGSWWKDKWHASPYYTTGHAVLALSQVAPSMTEQPIDWILSNQKEDGGWGFFGKSTVEESAYALQALLEYNSMIEKIDQRQMAQGVDFISSRINDNLERLWIAKGLFCPVFVVMSSVISALKWFESTCDQDPLRMEIMRWNHEVTTNGIVRGGK